MTPAIPLLSMYLKKIKSVSQRDTCTHMFTSSLFTIAKIWQQPMVLSVDEGIENVCVQTAMECYSAIVKENPVIHNSMDEPGGHYGKWSLIHEDKYYEYSHIWAI